MTARNVATAGALAALAGALLYVDQRHTRLHNELAERAFGLYDSLSADLGVIDRRIDGVVDVRARVSDLELTLGYGTDWQDDEHGLAAVRAAGARITNRRAGTIAAQTPPPEPDVDVELTVDEELDETDPAETAE